jgi:N-acetyl-gamma-glutamyl-phosphate reductase
MSASDKVRIGILGASGYTGAELLRFLLRHPAAEIRALTGDRSAGKPIGSVFPQLGGYGLPDLIAVDDVKTDDLDLIFCALPHGTTQEVIAALPRHLKIIDLSADFRLSDIESYKEWYGHAHSAPELQREAVYAITEFVRPALGNARLVANPGCYPTASQLPLVPLVAKAAIDADDIIIDAKSGVSGAGRAAKEGSLFTEVAEGIHAYGVASHRHAPEIEQGLSAAAGRPIIANFTAHLMPMSRGILASCYVKLANGASADDLREILQQRFTGEPFVRVVDKGVSPQTRHVRGSNLCLIGVFADRVKNRAIVLSAIDNLTKGASGQAIQNMNVMFGLGETTGIDLIPMFP